MGDYYGIMAKTAPQDAGETDAQAAGSPVADGQPSPPAVEGCQTQLVCQCENCRFWKGIIYFSCRYGFPGRPILADLSLADLEDFRRP